MKGSRHVTAPRWKNLGRDGWGMKHALERSENAFKILAGQSLWGNRTRDGTSRWKENIKINFKKTRLD